MVNYMKIHVNIEHELLCERFKHELPSNYPLIWVAVGGGVSKTRSFNNTTLSICAVWCYAITYTDMRVEDTPHVDKVASLRDASMSQPYCFTKLRSLRSLSMVLLRFSISDAV